MQRAGRRWESFHVRGVAWRGVAWRGVAWRGAARRGVAGRGGAGRGVAWRGAARRGLEVAQLMQTRIFVARRKYSSEI